MTGETPLLRASAIDAPVKGIFYLALGGLFLTVADAVLKWLSTSVPPGELLAGRTGVTLMLTIIVALRSSAPLAALRTRNLRDQIGRGVCAAVFSFLMIEAFRRMPLADVYSILFAAPFLLAALAPRLLDEKVGADRWFAIALGFAGVVLMLRPTGEGIRWAALFAVACAAISTFRDIFNRRLIATDTSLAIQLYTNVAVTAAGLATLPFAFVPIGWFDLGLIALCGVIQFVGQYYFVDAFRYAPATALAPFKYILLVWALAVGFVVWGDRPDGWSLAGTALIVGSGLFMLARSRRPAPAA